MKNNYSDTEIIEVLHSQDLARRNEVMKGLYIGQYPLVEKLVVGNSGTSDDAMDVFQDALVILFLKIRRNEFRHQSSIGTYLYGIARNLWLKVLRKKNQNLMLEVEDSYTDRDLEIFQKKQLTIREALEQIGSNCKRLLSDFYFNQLSMAKIQELYGLGSEEAARNKKYRCMQKLMSFVKKNKLSLADFKSE